MLTLALSENGSIPCPTCGAATETPCVGSFDRHDPEVDGDRFHGARHDAWWWLREERDAIAAGSPRLARIARANAERFFFRATVASIVAREGA